MYDDEIECEMAFRRWCADELVDPRLQDILEEAFTNGWIAKAAMTDAPTAALTASNRLRKLSLRVARWE